MLVTAFLTAIFWCGLVTVPVALEIWANGRYKLTGSDPAWCVTLSLIGQLHVLVGLVSTILTEAVPALQVLAFHAHFTLINWTAAREFRALSVYFVVVPLYHYVRATLRRGPASELVPITAQQTNRVRVLYNPTLVLLAGMLTSVGLIWPAARLLNDRHLFLGHVQMLLWIMTILLCVHLTTRLQRAWQRNRSRADRGSTTPRSTTSLET